MARVFAINVVVHCVTLLWCRRLRSMIRRDVASATFCFYVCTYANFAFWGLHAIGEGAMYLLGCPAPQNIMQGALTVLEGFATLLPMLIVFITGRKKLFQLTACSFDRDPSRVQRDGAFLATLLDCASRIRTGDTFWIHHGRHDEAYPTFDVRRNWELGKVVLVGLESFVVRTRAPLQGGEQMLARKLTRSRSGYSRGPSLFASVTSVKPEPGLHVLPLAGREMTVEDMLSFAHKELHCIDWGNITKELMTGAICGHDAPDISKLYDLSRPLRKGEVIDYFMSHSWHDCAESKWARLQEIVAEFARRNWRYPTFWLDKVCIDQRRIGDGLKALPVNVMACKQVLVLCGETYPDRLWCIWELCVVLSFASQEQALERIRFEVFGQDSTVLDRLQKFEAKNARCYDPNEQHKLSHVIRTIGAERFDTQIRRLAMAIEPALRGKPHHAPRSSTSSSASSSPQAAMLGARYAPADDNTFTPNVISI
eukprot:TRINITY_DN31236_c0_g1_i10.p1 TRINITY_DN31236_c0_g1~~TRINITY_DN31236_c0_g1_i10.p1  ORF type:complete len:547 (-),score=17.61 TRINITY_DN31236_c0_g1_i10:468-1913(-)